MREIKFRAYRWDTGWLYGDLVHSYIGTKICVQDETSPYDGFEVVVNPETVGQYTGLNDCYGVEIYEGDILAYTILNKKYKSEVVWNGDAYRCIAENLPSQSLGEYLVINSDAKVVGNIHEKG